MMDGETIEDEESSTLSVSESGSYTLITSNACGSDTTETYTVTVEEPINASLNIGGSLSFCAGGMVSLSANADTSAMFTWYHDDLVIEDEFSSDINVTEGGDYMVIVSNSCGTDTTETVMVIVNPLPAAPVITASGSWLLASPAGGVYEWFIDGDETGEMNDSIMITENGTYTVSITDANGCSSVSEEFDVDYLSLEDLSGKLVSLFPNPSAGQFSIAIGDYNGTLEVLNAEGRLVYSQEVSGNSQISIDLSREGSALYFVRLKGSSEVLRAIVTK
jgi:hypothetical protein